MMENNIDTIINNSINNIKPFPEMVQKAIALIDSGDLDNQHLAGIIKKDPILSAKILSLANSPFYGLSRKVEDVEAACIILGFNVIKNILIAAGALSCFPVNEQRIKIWEHSVEVASISELMAKKLDKPETTIYIAGLLHDVGKFVLLDYFPEHQSLIESSSYDSDNKPLADETKNLGTNHAKVGAEIITVWNLPNEIHNIVEKHHMPDESSDFTMCSILQLSDEISHKLEENKSDEEIMSELKHENIQASGFDVIEFNDLLPEFREKVDSIEGVVSKF